MKRSMFKYALGAIAIVLSVLVTASALPAQPASEGQGANWGQLCTELSEARMLRFRGPLPRRVCSAEEVSRIRTEQLRRLFLNDKTRAREAMLICLGLWPQDRDLEASIQSIVPSEPLDWYDERNHTLLIVPNSKALDLTSLLGKGAQYSYLLSSLGFDVNKLYRTYLLEHALQDQYFDLGQLLDKAQGDMDSQLALMALCEGDAMVTTVATFTSSLGMNLPAVLNAGTSFSPSQILNYVKTSCPEIEQAPIILQEYMMGVLYQGLKFASVVKERSGWGGLNRAFRQPPTSSKAILHPTQYVNGLLSEVTVQAKAPERVGELTLLGSDRCGEFLTGCWLKQRLGDKEAERLACSWVGDRWWTYGRGRDGGSKEGNNERLLLWVTAWSDSSAAQLFAKVAAAAGAKVELRAKDSLVVALIGSDIPQAQELLSVEVSKR